MVVRGCRLALPIAPRVSYFSWPGPQIDGGNQYGGVRFGRRTMAAVRALRQGLFIPPELINHPHRGDFDHRLRVRPPS